MKKLLKIVGVTFLSLTMLLVVLVYFDQKSPERIAEKAARAKIDKIAKAKKAKDLLVKRCGNYNSEIMKMRLDQRSWSGSYKEASEFAKSCYNLNPKKDKRLAKASKYLMKQHNKAMKEYTAYKKKEAKFVAKHGKEPQTSAWDGSVVLVKRYVKSIANDPSSIDDFRCDTVTRGIEGWETTCTFRGKNAFGGLVRNTKSFYITKGRVGVK